MCQLGLAGLGSTRLDPALLGLTRLDSARLGLAPLSLDRRDAARVGPVWFGVPAWLGLARLDALTRLGLACLGPVWPGSLGRLCPVLTFGSVWVWVFKLGFFCPVPPCI